MEMTWYSQLSRQANFCTNIWRLTFLSGDKRLDQQKEISPTRSPEPFGSQWSWVALDTCKTSTKDNEIKLNSSVPGRKNIGEGAVILKAPLIRDGMEKCILQSGRCTFLQALSIILAFFNLQTYGVGWFLLLSSSTVLANGKEAL